MTVIAPDASAIHELVLTRLIARQAEMQKAKSQGDMRDVTPDSKKKRPPRTGG